MSSAPSIQNYDIHNHGYLTAAHLSKIVLIHLEVSKGKSVAIRNEVAMRLGLKKYTKIKTGSGKNTQIEFLPYPLDSRKAVYHFIKDEKEMGNFLEMACKVEKEGPINKGLRAEGLAIISALFSGATVLRGNECFRLFSFSGVKYIVAVPWDESHAEPNWLHSERRLISLEGKNRYELFLDCQFSSAANDSKADHHEYSALKGWVGISTKVHTLNPSLVNASNHAMFSAIFHLDEDSFSEIKKIMKKAGTSLAKSRKVWKKIVDLVHKMTNKVKGINSEKAQAIRDKGVKMGTPTFVFSNTHFEGLFGVSESVLFAKDYFNAIICGGDRFIGQNTYLDSFLNKMMESENPSAKVVSGNKAEYVLITDEHGEQMSYFSIEHYIKMFRELVYFETASFSKHKGGVVLDEDKKTVEIKVPVSIRVKGKGCKMTIPTNTLTNIIEPCVDDTNHNEVTTSVIDSVILPINMSSPNNSEIKPKDGTKNRKDYTLKFSPSGVIQPSFQMLE